MPSPARGSRDLSLASSGWVAEQLAHAWFGCRGRAGGASRRRRAPRSSPRSPEARRGTYADWTGEVLSSRTTSDLGEQVKALGRRSDRIVRMLEPAWNYAEKFVTDNPHRWTAADAAEAARRVAHGRRLTADAEANLNKNDRAVLAAICDLAERYNSTVVICAPQPLADAAGSSKRAATTAVTRSTASWPSTSGHAVRVAAAQAGDLPVR
jgi:hypothetical protein